MEFHFRRLPVAALAPPGRAPLDDKKAQQVRPFGPPGCIARQCAVRSHPGTPAPRQAAANAVAGRWAALLAWACPAACSAAVGGVCAAASLLSCGAGGAGDRDQLTHERTQVRPPAAPT